jgi:hypothetical protein
VEGMTKRWVMVLPVFVGDRLSTWVGFDTREEGDSRLELAKSTFASCRTRRRDIDRASVCTVL